MKIPVLAAAILFGLAVTSPAEIPRQPLHSILQNRFTSLSTVPPFVVGVASNGLHVLDFDFQTMEFFRVGQVWLELDPTAVKISGDLMTIRQTDDRLVFLDLSSLPEPVYLGTLTPGISYRDFAVNGDDIYFSKWFEGIVHYTMTNYRSATFVDSNTLGILVTQLEVEGDTLFALDRYNGIIRYDISASNLSGPVDFLYTPFQTLSFTRLDSVFMLASLASDAFLGRFGLIGSGVFDSITGVYGPIVAYATDSLYLLLSDRFLTVVDQLSLRPVDTIPLDRHLVTGDIYESAGNFSLVLPRVESGFSRFELNDVVQVRSGLTRSGPITDLELFGGQLYIGGAANPVDVYQLDSVVSPALSYTIHPELDSISTFTRNGDTLIVFYPRLDRMALITNANDPDSFLLESSFTVNRSTVTEIEYVQHRFDTLHLMLIYDRSAIKVYTISDSSGLQPGITLSIFGGVDDLNMVDSILAVATGKSELWLYRVTPDIQFERIASFGLPGKVTAMISNNSTLYVFVSNTLLSYDLDDPLMPLLDRSVRLPLSVGDAVWDRDRLMTVSSEGLMALSLSDSSIDVMASGGAPGFRIVSENGLIATTNGEVVDIFYLPFANTGNGGNPSGLPTQFVLSQNFPNPFNSSTTIMFDLNQATQTSLRVYNILGQEVVTLWDGPLPEGTHIMDWDGRSASGLQVASGVYFYRLGVNLSSGSKKMLLAK